MSTLIPAWVDGQLAPVDKLEAHRLGLRHKAISIFVVDGEKTLLQRRAEGKYHSGGLWSNSCCTHPDWGEPLEKCALRRLREELGITGIYPAHTDRIEYRADVGNGLIEHEVVDIYIAYARPDMTLAPVPEEVSEVKWMGLYDLVADVQRHPEKYSKWLAIYLSSHLDRIFGTLIR